MADVLRSCSKTACRWPAAASLSYRYATRQVWLLDLQPAPDPSLYDLCPHHADHLVVPNGWECVDSRTAHEVMVEPSADDRAEQAARRRQGLSPAAETAQRTPRELVGATTGRNRYAALVEQLPRLAAESGVPGAATIGAGPVDSEAVAEVEASVRANAEAEARSDVAAREIHHYQQAEEPPLPPTAGHQQARAARPIPSRELSPLPADASWEPPPPPPQPVAEEPPIPGQLVIPVDDPAGGHSGVILPFNAGSRRRPRS
jgi:hypothetical protein